MYRIVLFLSLLFTLLFDTKACDFCQYGIRKKYSISSFSPTRHTNEKEWEKSFSLRLSPAFFWKTIGLELEYAISPSISIGSNLFAKVGRMDGKKANFKIKDEPFLENGWRAELYMNYYFSKKAPEGIYLQVNGGYNKLIYFDGNTRPYTLHNHWKQLKGVRVTTDLEKPKPYVGGLALGYQFLIIPDHIIANISSGIMANVDQDNSLFFTIYLAPSIGIKF